LAAQGVHQGRVALGVFNVWVDAALERSLHKGQGAVVGSPTAITSASLASSRWAQMYASSRMKGAAELVAQALQSPALPRALAQGRTGLGHVVEIEAAAQASVRLRPAAVAHFTVDTSPQ
jgi:hypothetical protein